MNGMPVWVKSPDGKAVVITKNGQLVTASLYYDLTKYNELAEADTAYKFYDPKAGSQFIITGIVMYADKQVGTSTGATVEIYEATTATTITVTRELFKMEVPQGGYPPIPQLNIGVNEGFYINAKTDDDDVHVNIMGYYIDNTGETF